MPAHRTVQLTDLDRIDADLLHAASLRLTVRTPEQDHRLSAEIDRLLDERLTRTAR